MRTCDELRREVLAVERPEAREEHLVETEGACRAVTIGVVVDEHLSIGEHSVVYGVPVTAEVICDLGHRTREAADLHRRPPSRSRRHRHPRRGDARVLLAPGGPLTVRLLAAKASLVPTQSRRATETREIEERDDALFFQLCDDTALWAADRDPSAFEMDLGDRPVKDPEHHDVGEADQDLAHPLGVALEPAKYLSS